jgi:hypothetical protein
MLARFNRTFRSRLSFVTVALAAFVAAGCADDPVGQASACGPRHGRRHPDRLAEVVCVSLRRVCRTDNGVRLPDGGALGQTPARGNVRSRLTGRTRHRSRENARRATRLGKRRRRLVLIGWRRVCLAGRSIVSRRLDGRFFLKNPI